MPRGTAPGADTRGGSGGYGGRGGEGVGGGRGTNPGRGGTGPGGRDAGWDRPGGDRGTDDGGARRITDDPLRRQGYYPSRPLKATAKATRIGRTAPGDFFETVQTQVVDPIRELDDRIQDFYETSGIEGARTGATIGSAFGGVPGAIVGGLIGFFGSRREPSEAAAPGMPEVFNLGHRPGTGAPMERARLMAGGEGGRRVPAAAEETPGKPKPGTPEKEEESIVGESVRGERERRDVTGTGPAAFLANVRAQVARDQQRLARI